MNKKMIFVCGMILTSCFSHHTMMTQESYAAVQIGTSIDRVTQEMGEPYSITTKNDGEEYSYIERITAGNRLLYENHYIFFVRQGVIVDKRIQQEKRPAFDLIYQDDPNHNQYP